MNTHQYTDQEVLFRLATPDDEALFEHVAEDVFDNAIIPQRLQENLKDRRLHLALAISNGLIVGMAAGMHYSQPDKDPQFFVDELGVAPGYQRRGIGRGLLQLLLELAQGLGCKEAWVATEEDNRPAKSLYASMPNSQESRAVIYTFTLS
ncbi:MAG: GNAT family N-acetyltransferase [Pirellulaceae bacterium]|nr:GNAT family N-acetyltransferase [Pirellulaceae bacterium]